MCECEKTNRNYAVKKHNETYKQGKFYMISAIIYAIGGFIEIVIGLRFLFRLLGADPNAGFVRLVYDWSAPLVTPFAGIFGQEATVLSDAGTVTASVFDWTALIALIVYGLIIALITRVLTRSGV